MHQPILHQLKSSDSDLIDQLADIYYNEWGFAKDTMSARLQQHPDEGILLQLAILVDNKVVAAGGLYNEVGLLEVHPRFKKYKPWVAMVATVKEYRNRGFATRLLLEIQERAVALGFKKLFLYTSTAEKLYERNGWETFTSVEYKGKPTALMHIVLPGTKV